MRIPVPAKANPYRARLVFNEVSFVIGPETASRTVTVQLIDATGEPIAERGSLMMFLSDVATGAAVTATAPDVVAAGSKGSIIPLVAGKAFQVVSDANGAIEIVITENGAASWYLVAAMPDGNLTVSEAITFA